MRAAVLVLVLLLAGCKWAVIDQPLVVASCPPLTPLAGESFGDTTVKLIEVAGQYHECRCAALPETCK